MEWFVTIATFKALTLGMCQEMMPSMEYGCTEVVMECTLDEGFENHSFCASEDYLSGSYDEIKEYQREFEHNAGIRNRYSY